MNKLQYRIWFAVLLSLGFFQLFGQKKNYELVRKIVSQNTVGDRFDNQLVRAVQSNDGGTLVIGNHENPYNGGWDGLLSKFDKRGKVLFQTPFGQDGADFATSVAEGPMGNILIGGKTLQTKTRTKKTETAWLMCRDLNGDMLWQAPLDSSKIGEVSVEEVIWSEETQEFLCIGLHNGWLFLASVSENGQLLYTKIYEKEIGKRLKMARARLLNHHVYVFGTAILSDSRNEPIFIKIEASGIYKEHVPFPDFNTVSTGNMLPINRGKFMATGSVKTGLDRGDAFLMKLDTSMIRAECGFYQVKDKGLDEGADLAQVANGTYLIAGSSTSYGSGARTTNFATWLVNGVGTPLDEETGWYFGNNLEERGRAIFQKSDGSIWFFGTRNVGSSWGQNDDFYIACLKKSTEPVAQEAAETVADVQLNIQHKGFLGSQGHLTLQSHQKGFINFELQNKGKDASEKLMAVIRPVDCADEINLPDTLFINPIGGGKKSQWALPVSANQLAENRQNRFDVTIFDKMGKKLAQSSASFGSEREKLLAFDVTESRFSCDGNMAIQKGRPVKFCFELLNSGEVDAHSLMVNFQAPGLVNFSGNTEFEVPFLAKGARRRFEVILLPETSFSGSELTVNVYWTALGENRAGTFNKTYTSAIDPEKLELPAPEVVEIALAPKEAPSKPPAKTEPPHIEVRMPAERTEMGEEGIKLSVVWMDDSLFENRQLTVLNDKYEVKVMATSIRELKIGDFTIIVNGERVQLDGSKFEEEPLRRVGKTHNFRFSYRVPLRFGKNALAVEVKNPAGLTSTEEVSVFYKAISKGTLYVLSIGVPDISSNGLKYTQKDALDFAQLFSKQEGRLFGNVVVQTLTTVEETRAAQIGAAINEFRLMAARNLLTPKDAIILFISTHGMQDIEGVFRLRASDFNGNSVKYTTINYQKDIIEELADLTCKKFVFLDACHSGALYADSGYNGKKGGMASYGDAMYNLASADNNFRTITSCGKQEFSFEDDRWKNGAFTKVLKELLANPALCKQLDKGVKGISSPDNALSLAEVYEYVQKTVNELVKTERKESQTPFLAPKSMAEDVPFYAY